MIDLLLEIGELFLSWRLYVGFVITGLLCWLSFTSISNESVRLLVCVPVGLVGVFLSFRWQIRAEKD